ncbi:MAG: DMT family transporter [Hyphomicrobiales bacterium]|nr:MAG: DMT family transporter [Hyphomicrobiales bacterium]
MSTGVILAFVSFLLFSIADALVKVTGTGMPAFEIAFFTILFSIIPVALTNRRHSWRNILKLKHPLLVHLRSVAIGLSGACGIFALTQIALADYYAIAFTTPLFVTVLSVLFLGEKVAPHRWGLLLISFLGVLLVIRPGFDNVLAGHLTILAGAGLTAVSNTILRKVAADESPLSIVALGVLYGMIFNGVLMLPGFVMPSLAQLALFLGHGLCVGVAWLLMIQASTLAPANAIAPTHYSQMIWAILFGALWFGEYPDWVALVGLVIVVASGLLNVIAAAMPPRKRALA